MINKYSAIEATTPPVDSGKVEALEEAVERGFNKLYKDNPTNQRQEAYNIGLCNMLQVIEDELTKIRNTLEGKNLPSCDTEEYI
jgi:hypothetical protein